MQKRHLQHAEYRQLREYSRGGEEHEDRATYNHGTSSRVVTAALPE